VHPAVALPLVAVAFVVGLRLALKLMFKAVRLALLLGAPLALYLIHLH
jgi:hypothetical protein